MDAKGSPGDERQPQPRRRIAVVAAYVNRTAAEDAARILAAAGIPAADMAIGVPEGELRDAALAAEFGLPSGEFRHRTRAAVAKGAAIGGVAGLLLAAAIAALGGGLARVGLWPLLGILLVAATAGGIIGAAEVDLGMDDTASEYRAHLREGRALLAVYAADDAGAAAARELVDERTRPVARDVHQIE